MSDGYAANYAWVMSFEKAREIAPAEMEEFEEELAAYDAGDLWGSGLEAWANGDASLPINAAFNKLVESVGFATGGLEISAMSYSKDDGDIYDDIPWPCFWVDRVEQFTPAGLSAIRSGSIHGASWVTFG